MKKTKRIPVPKKVLSAEKGIKKSISKPSEAKKGELKEEFKAAKSGASAVKKTKSSKLKKPFIGAKSAVTKESKDAYIKKILLERKKKK